MTRTTSTARPPEPRRGTPRGRVGRVLVGVTWAALSGPTIGLTTPPPADPPPSTGPSDQTPSPRRDDLTILADTAAAPEARAQAARRMLSAADPAASSALVEMLSAANRSSDCQQIILRELGQASSVPEAFLAPLEAWLKESTPDRHFPLYRAISSIRTRRAARLLLSYAGPSALGENREAVFQLLGRMTGRTDLGSERAAWERWLNAAEQLTEEQWKDQLAASVAQRADSLRLQRDEALRRLVESERSRFLEATDPAVRSGVLIQLLRDDQGSLRRLGIELVNRELANARELGPGVGYASLELLKDPAADVRSAGADLIDRLIPTGAALAVREALARERDPNVLAKLLRLTKRFPDIAPPELLMGWLGAETAVRRAAIDAIAALQASGQLASPIDHQRALQTLRSERPEDLSLDGLRLLCELGNDQDRDAVARLLSLPSADARLRAAQALDPFAPHLDRIVDVAKSDASLFSIAASALARHRANLAGYRALVSLPAPTPAAMREAINALCRRMPLLELLEAARETPDAETRESILARAVNLTAAPNGVTDFNPFAGPEGERVAEALVMLAQAQLDVLRPQAALGTLELLDNAGEAIASRLIPLKLKGLLYLDRLEDALQFEASADQWLDALDYSAALPHALAIATEIRLRFGTDLTVPQKQRYDLLVARASEPRASRSENGGER